MLAVHPGYQGRGAGAALVRWGTAVADDRAIEVKSSSYFLLHSSPICHSSCGI
jgi:GNAT superfamily N-acetyltransferase